MLHILLLILKIIGIVLLCILGMLLLGIACALVVPIRYRIEAVRKEGEGELPVVVTVKVTWLLHFVNVLIRFSGSLSVRARLMFITVFRLPKKEKRGGKARAGKAEGGKETKTESGKDGTESETGTEPPESKAADGKTVTAAQENGTVTETKAVRLESEEPAERNRDIREAKKNKVTIAVDATNKCENHDEETNAETADDSGKKPALWEKLRAVPEILRKILAKIKSIFENIQYTIQNICDKIRAVSDTIEYYRGVIEGEPFKRSFALCKEELLTIFKRLKPDRFEAALIVGMDDPASTGEILAVCGMLYPILGPKVNVVGDFERKRLEGRVFIKGKLRLFTFLRAAVRIYFNKDIRKLYSLLKKEAV